MTLISLLVVAMLNAGAVLWLVHYVPLARKKVKKKWFSKKTIVSYWSPRLWLCDNLWAFDVIVSFVLVVGPLIGISFGGIQTLVFNTFVALGLSFGVWITTRFVVSHWKKQFLLEVEELKKEA